MKLILGKLNYAMRKLKLVALLEHWTATARYRAFAHDATLLAQKWLGGMIRIWLTPSLTFRNASAERVSELH